MAVNSKEYKKLKIFEQYARMFYFKPSAVPPFMIPRELFWEQRRDASFKKQFEIAKQNTVLIQVRASIGRKIDIMCRIGVFRLPQIFEFVAELRKSVYFTVE